MYSFIDTHSQLHKILQLSYILYLLLIVPTLLTASTIDDELKKCASLGVQMCQTSVDPATIGLVLVWHLKSHERNISRLEDQINAAIEADPNIYAAFRAMNDQTLSDDDNNLTDRDRRSPSTDNVDLTQSSKVQGRAPIR
jgi:hypothetical protein